MNAEIRASAPVVQAPEVFGKVAVLMGGLSSEREISLKTGTAVLQALQRRGVNAEKVDAAVDALGQLQAGGFDRVFIALHGRGGEDGVIQGALETIGLPYTGSGVLGSAIGMDKLRTKYVWQGAGVPTPVCRLLRVESDLDSVARSLGLPLMIKPAREGSSVGMTKVTAEEQLHVAWETAARFDACVLAEQCIEGGEYTAAVLDHEVMPLIRLETPRSFYDYAAKYEADDTRYVCPCGLDEDTERNLQALSLHAFDTVGASGWGRVDFMLDGAGGPWFIEVNTVPGLTDHSLVPMSARAAGMGFDELALRILQTSLTPDH